MRVLIVNTSSDTGGAAIAASRLTAALNRYGVEAQMVVRRSKWAFLWERFCIWLANGFRRKRLWDVDIANAGTDITHLPAFHEADIVHLHWVNQGFLSMRQIRKIMESGKPVVWTLHDMWPITAICHHTDECERYKTHCLSCPLLQRPYPRDLSWHVFNNKERAYARGNITFIGVSQWMTHRAQQSALTEGHSVVTIPNVLPLDQFQRGDRQQARQALQLPADTIIIAFGAARIDQPLKGFDRLLEALTLITTPVHLVLFGNVKDSTCLQHIPCPYTHVGTLTTPEALSRLYTAADIVVNASDYESFGLTLAEALACGCMAVSFDRGGQSDIIEHRKNGYLARYPDVADLAAGIEWAIHYPVAPEQLRLSVTSRFSPEVVARQHIQLYEGLCAARG